MKRSSKFKVVGFDGKIVIIKYGGMSREIARVHIISKMRSK